jgi:hypothetical protein
MVMTDSLIAPEPFVLLLFNPLKLTEEVFFTRVINYCD